MPEREIMTRDYDWVSRALEYLGENFQDQPELEGLSRHLGISPFHLQRVFTRWVGISPKRFLQYLTLDYARQMLTESRSVLDAAFDSGLSGPGGGQCRGRQSHRLLDPLSSCDPRHGDLRSLWFWSHAQAGPAGLGGGALLGLTLLLISGRSCYNKS